MFIPALNKLGIRGVDRRQDRRSAQGQFGAGAGVDSLQESLAPRPVKESQYLNPVDPGRGYEKWASTLDRRSKEWRLQREE
jgi:hypothetical protein